MRMKKLKKRIMHGMKLKGVVLLV